MNEYIRTNLAQLRFTAGRLTQREVSQATGIGQKTLSALETGVSKGIEFKTLTKLCVFFSCEPSDILVIEEEAEAVPPSKFALGKAEELIARGLQAAMTAPKQTPEEIWAEFDAVRERLQKQESGAPAKKSKTSRA